MYEDLAGGSARRCPRDGGARSGIAAHPSRCRALGARRRREVRDVPRTAGPAHVQRRVVAEDVQFLDGTLEFDVAVSTRRNFPMVGLRRQEKGEYEEFYFRTHKSELPERYQYVPPYQGVGGWQLYHGPGFTAKAVYPRDQWFPIRDRPFGNEGRGVRRRRRRAAARRRTAAPGPEGRRPRVLRQLSAGLGAQGRARRGDLQRRPSSRARAVRLLEIDDARERASAGRRVRMGDLGALRSRRAPFARSPRTPFAAGGGRWRPSRPAWSFWRSS